MLGGILMGLLRDSSLLFPGEQCRVFTHFGLKPDQLGKQKFCTFQNEVVFHEILSMLEGPWIVEANTEHSAVECDQNGVLDKVSIFLAPGECVQPGLVGEIGGNGGFGGFH